LVSEIVQSAISAVCNISTAPIDTISVFIPHSIYKAVMVYLQLPRLSRQENVDASIRALVDLLSLMSTRWISAGMLKFSYCSQARVGD
jgi:hypothetical protein